MTERKPPGVGWESWIDKQVGEGRARGDFDHLPGTGKPLRGIDEPRDELWWVRDKLRSEGIEYLPPSLAMRRDAETARMQALGAPTEREARRIVTEVNERIRYLNSHMVEGPPTTVMPLDVDAIVGAWRDLHPEPPPRPTEPPSSTGRSGPSAPSTRRRSRLLRRLRWRRHHTR